MKKVFLVFITIILVVNAGMFLTGNRHLYKAIYHTYADIDDYKIFENNTIAATSGAPWNLHTSYNKSTMLQDFDTLMEAWDSKAFVIIKNDSLLFEKYWDGYNDTTISGSFSVAKSIVNVLVGCALREGKIRSLDDAVGNYIDEFNIGANNKITIRHLLQMASGLEWDEAYSSAFSITTKAYYGTDLYNLCANLQAREAPGKVFNYQSCNSELLGMIVIKATGMSLAAYAAQKLWIPLQAEHKALWSVDRKDGLEKAYCCFNATARDFARIGKLYLQMGNYNGQQIVDTSFVINSTTPNQLAESDGTPCLRYGLHWWCINKNGIQCYFARGILGQYIFVFPSLNAIAVRLGNGRGEPTPDKQLTDIHFYVDQTVALCKK
ncbi:MAG: serine hydrolase [Bacteroidetes bacterium]|nr:serine hydrolase [Bacteroidota bacterium]